MKKMKITEANLAFKIMDVKHTKGRDKLDFNYLKSFTDEKGVRLPSNILSQKVPRVYIIVVNGFIYKIGQSDGKGGMKGTLQIYKDGGVKGSPSVRSYGVFHLMKSELEKGSKIEFYMIYQDKIKTDVKGLYRVHKEKLVNIHPKYIEEYCLLDFKEKTNDYPVWNFQEQGKDWPDLIKQIHAELKVAASQRKGRNK